MTVLLIAHRAGNELALMAPAMLAGADLIEADVHLRRGRLEVRHAKSLGVLPWLWEPWYLLPRSALQLRNLNEQLPDRAQLMLDLKGWQPWIGERVRAAMAGVGPYTVCSRHWRVLDVFADLPEVRVVHSVRTRAELARLDARLAAHRTWGVSIHLDLLTAARVGWLRERAAVVMTWPIDDPATYDRVLGLGVNGVISNDLLALAAG